MIQYEEFFGAQQGGGRGVGRVFVGAPFQRGHGGIGSFLTGVFRRVLPLLTRGARTIGKEALRTGMNIMSDVSANTPIRDSFRNRMRESGEKLKRKAEEKIDKLMEGSGYKAPRHMLSLQSIVSSKAVNKRRKRKKRSSVKKKTKRLSRKKDSGGVKKRTKKRKHSKKKKKKKRTTRDIFG